MAAVIGHAHGLKGHHVFQAETCFSVRFMLRHSNNIGLETKYQKKIEKELSNKSMTHHKKHQRKRFFECLVSSHYVNAQSSRVSVIRFMRSAELKTHINEGYNGCFLWLEMALLSSFLSPDTLPAKLVAYMENMAAHLRAMSRRRRMSSSLLHKTEYNHF